MGGRGGEARAVSGDGAVYELWHRSYAHGLRLARSFTGKPGVIKFERHFHGWHDYVAASSKYAGIAPAGVPASTMESVAVLPLIGDRRRDSGAARRCGRHHYRGRGCFEWDTARAIGLSPGIAQIHGDKGIVMIMDEVVTGFRWAPGGVQEVEGVTPDLTTMAKILAGGFPGGAVAGRRDVMARLSFPEPGTNAGEDRPPRYVQREPAVCRRRHRLPARGRRRLSISGRPRTMRHSSGPG